MPGLEPTYRAILILNRDMATDVGRECVADIHECSAARADQLASAGRTKRA